MGNRIKFDFLKSIITSNNVNKYIDWIKKQNDLVDVKINKIKFEDLTNWHFDSKNTLSHNTGKFF